MPEQVTGWDPKKVTVAAAGTALTGFATDGVVNIVANEDRVTTQTGVKGDTTYSENANESATATIPLMSTSASLPKLRQLAQSRKRFTLTISDANDDSKVFVNAENCRITKMPDYNAQKEASTVNVPVYIPRLEYR